MSPYISIIERTALSFNKEPVADVYFIKCGPFPVLLLLFLSPPHVLSLPVPCSLSSCPMFSLPVPSSLSPSRSLSPCLIFSLPISFPSLLSPSRSFNSPAHPPSSSPSHHILSPSQSFLSLFHQLTAFPMLFLTPRSIFYVDPSTKHWCF